MFSTSSSIVARYSEKSNASNSEYCRIKEHDPSEDGQSKDSYYTISVYNRSDLFEVRMLK
ncbi:hypothetical protein J2848_001256 [Azospirillum lipoferum]|nr:hypothetical protein [Azospirillum lipoferum]